jgi:hypothetical protein
MERNQKIYCDVNSCKFNTLDNICSLKEIQVSPVANCNTGKANESKCSSYKCEE